MNEVKVTIIGAGVVGLAIAAELSQDFDEVLVLERNSAFGQETSSRNSEVIHSGIYYAPGSLKTRLCIEGARLLYDLCERHSVPHKKLGKLIVARNETELKALENLYNNAINNGICAISIIDKKKVSGFGVNVKAEAAIYLPDTGIVDSHSLMKHYARFSEDKGATIAYNSTVTRIERTANAYKLLVEQDADAFSSRIVVNCAGLSSDHVAGLTGIDIDKHSYKLHYCKGSYFHYAKKHHMPLLIYPVPEQELTGLGVHAVLDMGGRLKFGPDTEYVDEIDYTVDENRRFAFYESAAKTFPDLDKDAFVPDMAGVRPKLSGPGERARDFVIVDEEDKGLPGFIDLIGIESPGLTSSPAIARMVAGMVKKRLA